MADKTVHALKNAIAAYNYGDYEAAIPQLEKLYQSAEDELVRIQAQKTLIQAYRKIRHIPQAIALCQDLLDHPVYQSWAQKALVKLESALARLEQRKESDEELGEDSSGELSQISGSLCPKQLKLPIFPNYHWRNAGRAKIFKPLKSRSGSGLAVALLFSISALLLIIDGTLNSVVGIINILWLTATIKLTQLPILTLPSCSVALIMGIGLIFLVISPKRLDQIFQQSYELQPLSLEELALTSRESATLLEDFKKKKRKNQIRLGLLPLDVPLILSYGHFSHNARIIMSQGLLRQLEEDEIATLVATQLGQIQQWVFPFISAMIGLLQFFYESYWQMIKVASRKWPYYLIIFPSSLATILYAVYRLLRIPVLSLSRQRVYDSDRFAVNLTGNPNGLSRSLLKIAMGYAFNLKKHKHNPRILEGFDLLLPVAPLQALTFGSLPPKSDLEAAWRWDWSNPCRHSLNLGNSHPLLGERIYKLNQYAQFYELPTEFYINTPDSALSPQENPLQSYQALPPWQSGIVCAILVGIILYFVFFGFKYLGIDLQFLLPTLVLISFSISLISRINAYFPELKSSKLQEEILLPDFLSIVEAVPSKSKTVALQGKLLGRRGVGNWLGQDLILQTTTGFIPLCYGAWGGWLTQMFPSVKHPCDWINQTVTVKGWLRRGGIVWLDIQSLTTEDGQFLRGRYPLWFLLLALIAAYGGLYFLLIPSELSAINP